MLRACATIVMLAAATIAMAGASGGTSSLTVSDIDGHAWTPLSPAKGETNLLFFVSADCPVSARYAPEIDRVAASYAARGVRTWLIYADLTATIRSVRDNLKAFHPGANAPAIIDAGFQLTAAVDATVTPEAAIYTAAGRQYRGRIDDLYVSIGKSRREALHHDLRDALDAVLAGRAVATPQTDAVGCFIERPRRTQVAGAWPSWAIARELRPGASHLRATWEFGGIL
jgi:hypothetical protein